MKIYKYIHKKHHEWTASISWVAVYSNPIEHIFSNIVPIYMGTLICGSHVATSKKNLLSRMKSKKWDIKNTYILNDYNFPYLVAFSFFSSLSMEYTCGFKYVECTFRIPFSIFPISWSSWLPSFEIQPVLWSPGNIRLSSWNRYSI